MVRVPFSRGFILSITKTDLRTWRKFADKVFVARAQLRPAEWATHFRRLVRNAPAIAAGLEDLGATEADDAVDPRLFLVWTWCVLLSMPSNLREKYTALKEGWAGGFGLDAETERLRLSGLALEGLDTVAANRLRWLAAMTRLLDDRLASLDYWPEDRSRWSQDDWRPGDYPCFVVPVKREYRLKDGKEAEYRATRYHALVPAHVGELDIELVLHEDSTGEGEPSAWRYGAAVFDDVIVEPEHIGEDEFLLVAAPGPSAEDAIEEQVAKALGDRCDVLAWPELTVPPDRLDKIRAVLGRNPLSSPERIPIVVAGSWHVPVGGGHVNRCEVLQGKGKSLTHCDKRRRFEFLGRKEAIEPTRRIPIVVMDDRLVAVSICLDFCDDRVPDLYADLGLDLVIVPSMGKETTTESHQRHATTLQSRQGGVTILVQQHPYLEAEAQREGDRGYSFASPPNPARTVQNDRYRKLTARR